ncbi:MAG TPA: cell envelope integrity protein TolA [Gammaproteobacteria bacterium]|nr:cell envelope integrity protein TolA [Gammaproteobacteria bacterium]
MWRFVRENPRAFSAALLVHLALLLLLVVSLDWNFSPSLANKPAPVHAIAIDARKLDAQAEKRRKAEQARRKAEAEKKRKAEQARRKAEAEKKRKAEQARRKAEAEKKRKAEQARRKAEAEKKRKAEQARRKAEAEKRRKAEQARRKAEAQRRQAELKRQLAEEKARLEAERRAAMQRVVDRYGLYIKEKVQRSWIRPAGSGARLSCVVEVRLIPGGEVVNVRIVRSSGNAAFDRSVEAAVFRASPLPVPDEPDLMNQFRSITFEFNPDS